MEGRAGSDEGRGGGMYDFVTFISGLGMRDYVRGGFYLFCSCLEKLGLAGIIGGESTEVYLGWIDRLYVV